MVKVYTLGYAQPGAVERLQELVSEPNTLLIDTRKWPYINPQKSSAYWVKTWDRSALEAKYGERYHWSGEFLGNPNAFNGGPLAMIDPVRGINGLLYYLSRGFNLVLLCGCKVYEECHRSYIIAKLKVALSKVAFDVEIVPESVIAQAGGDVVVTVPLSFGLNIWIDEGDPVGEEWSGEEWHFYLAGPRPKMQPGDRVYVVYNGVLRGYAPLVRIDDFGSQFGLVRHGGAQAVTIPVYVQGFRGWRYRWWDRDIEVPFPDWDDPDAVPAGVERPARRTSAKNASRKSRDEREIEQGLTNIAHGFGIEPQWLLGNFEEEWLT